MDRRQDLPLGSRVELTPFVREVVIPGGPGAIPRIDARAARFLLEFRSSRIHRWGIFAQEPIPARRVVIEYTGQVITPAEAIRRSLRPSIFTFWLSPRRLIDGAIGGSGAEYINHSCAPNLIARWRRGRIFLSSRRAIAAGEELLLDYQLAGNLPRIPCGCGSPDCRGYLNAPRF